MTRAAPTAPPRRLRTIWCRPGTTPTVFPRLSPTPRTTMGPWQFPEKLIPLVSLNALEGRAAAGSTPRLDRGPCRGALPCRAAGRRDHGRVAAGAATAGTSGEASGRSIATARAIRRPQIPYAMACSRTLRAGGPPEAAGAASGHHGRPRRQDHAAAPPPRRTRRPELAPRVAAGCALLGGLAPSGSVASHECGGGAGGGAERQPGAISPLVADWRGLRYGALAQIAGWREAGFDVVFVSNARPSPEDWDRLSEQTACCA